MLLRKNFTSQYDSAHTSACPRVAIVATRSSCYHAAAVAASPPRRPNTTHVPTFLNSNLTGRCLSKHQLIDIQIEITHELHPARRRSLPLSDDGGRRHSLRAHVPFLDVPATLTVAKRSERIGVLLEPVKKDKRPRTTLAQNVQPPSITYFIPPPLLRIALIYCVVMLHIPCYCSRGFLEMLPTSKSEHASKRLSKRPSSINTLSRLYRRRSPPTKRS